MDAGAQLPVLRPGSATWQLCDRRLSGPVCEMGTIVSTLRGYCDAERSQSSSGKCSAPSTQEALCTPLRISVRTYLQDLPFPPVYCVGIHVNLGLFMDFVVNPQDPRVHCLQRSCRHEVTFTSLIPATNQILITSY